MKKDKKKIEERRKALYEALKKDGKIDMTFEKFLEQF